MLAMPPPLPSEWPFWMVMPASSTWEPAVTVKMAKRLATLRRTVT